MKEWNDNCLELYDKIRQVPDNAKKTISAGRLKGKTDINPMWRIKTLTEQFGPCGFGWRYEIIKMWNEQGANGEISSFVHINLFVLMDVVIREIRKLRMSYGHMALRYNVYVPISLSYAIDFFPIFILCLIE